MPQILFPFLLLNLTSLPATDDCVCCSFLIDLAVSNVDLSIDCHICVVHRNTYQHRHCRPYSCMFLKICSLMLIMAPHCQHDPVINYSQQLPSLISILWKYKGLKNRLISLCSVLFMCRLKTKSFLITIKYHY